MTTLYGIANCDTVKKAKKWLDARQITYQFHDFRKDGFDHALLSLFLAKTSWEQLLNKRSTSYRNLSDDIKQNLTEQTAISAMLAEPTLIKRPVTLANDKLIVGFNESSFAQQFLS